MKIMNMYITKKNGHYVNAGYVVENAIEKVKDFCKKNNYNVRIRNTDMTAVENGTCTIMAYTINDRFEMMTVED